MLDLGGTNEYSVVSGSYGQDQKDSCRKFENVDVVVELLDARIPASSKNPEIDGIVKNKPKIVVLNKADLADEKISNEWSKYGTILKVMPLFLLIP